MKIIYIIFFSFASVLSQEREQVPIFEYEISYNLGKALVKKGYVFNYNNNIYYNTSETVFLEKIKKITKNKDTGIPNLNILSAGNGAENSVSKTKENTRFTSYSIGNQIVNVEEGLVTQKWKLTGLAKKINKRNCVELTTTFRGRNYIAYVDLSIPINFGPWKFNNLPGVPVLIVDTKNKLKWTLSGIRNQTKENIKTFVKKQKKYLESLKKMSLEKYVSLYDKTNNGHTLLTARMPRKYKQKKSFKNHKRGGLELLFEWEK